MGKKKLDQCDWSNPAAYLVILGLSILVSTGIWIGRMEYFRGTVEKTLVDIKADIGKILDHLLRAPVISSESPIKLTDYGRTISGELDADKWAEERVARFKNELKDKSPYEIQEFCFELAKSNGLSTTRYWLPTCRRAPTTTASK